MSSMDVSRTTREVIIEKRKNSHRSAAEVALISDIPLDAYLAWEAGRVDMDDIRVLALIERASEEGPETRQERRRLLHLVQKGTVGTPDLASCGHMTTLAALRPEESLTADELHAVLRLESEVEALGEAAAYLREKIAMRERTTHE